MGVIYRITHRESGKIYIGKTKRTLKIRIIEHLYNSRSHSRKSYIDCAIWKHGIDAFEISVIEECDDEEELNEREKFWIEHFNCKVPNGYNLTDGEIGATGKVLSLEHRKKISLANKGKKRSHETRKKMSETWMGHEVSEETRKKISESSKNKRPIRCLETGKIFESIRKALKKTGITSLSHTLQKSSYTSGGYHWVDAN